MKTKVKPLSCYDGKRKYYTQMTEEETQSLKFRLLSRDKWKIGTHALKMIEERLQEKGNSVKFGKEFLRKPILNGRIIEYKVDLTVRADSPEPFYDERVLLKSMETVESDSGKQYTVNIVFSLSSNRVVTVWLNSVDFHHPDVDMSIYDENMYIPIMENVDLKNIEKY